MNKIISALLAASSLTLVSTNAAVILADDLADVTVGGTGNTEATIGAWDEVGGISAPSTTLTFQNSDNSSNLELWDSAIDSDVPAGEVLPRINMNTGFGWDLSLGLVVNPDVGYIDLTSIAIDIRLANNGGSNNTTGSKNGEVDLVLTGSVSGVLGTVNNPTQSYPTVEYTRNYDLSSLPDLDGSETYTLTLQARGTGFGHFKSLQGFSLEGNIVPEPSSTALLGLACVAFIMRRRR